MKKIITAILAGAMMFGSVAPAMASDVSHCKGLDNPSRFNPTELNPFQACVAKAKGQMSGLVGNYVYFIVGDEIVYLHKNEVMGASQEGLTEKVMAEYVDSVLVGQLEAQIATLEGEIESLEEQLNDAIDDVSEKDAMIENLNGQITALTEARNALQATVDGEQDRIDTAVADAVAPLNDRISTLEGQVTTLTEQRDAKELARAQAQQYLDAANASLDRIQTFRDATVAWYNHAEYNTATPEQIALVEAALRGADQSGVKVDADYTDSSITVTTVEADFTWVVTTPDPTTPWVYTVTLTARDGTVTTFTDNGEARDFIGEGGTYNFGGTVNRVTAGGGTTVVSGGLGHEIVINDESFNITGVDVRLHSVIADAVNAAYDAGYASGYDEGYDDGYADGYRDGFRDGVAATR